MDCGVLRRQAARFRRLAELITDETMAREMLALASEYEARAAQIESSTASVSPR